MLSTTLLVSILAFFPTAALSEFPSQSPKRGLCHVPNKNHPEDDQKWNQFPSTSLRWYYNYKAEPSPSYGWTPLNFVPMLWGATDDDKYSTQFRDSVIAIIRSGINITHVLGFNEPDGSFHTGGSSVSPHLAATAWKFQMEPLKKYGVKLGAPAVTGSQRGFEWLESFFKECAGACNPDFIPVHYYGNFEGMASHIGQVMGTYPKYPLWITEWAYPFQNLEVTQQFFETSIEYFDRIDNITNYSYFGAFRSSVSNVGANAAMLTGSGKLTDIGSWYIGGEKTGNIPTDSGSGKAAAFTGWVLCFILVAWSFL